MIAAPPHRLSRAGVLAFEQSHALSAEAQLIYRIAADVRRYFDEAVSLRREACRALAALETARVEALDEGWDGEGARPIDPIAYEMAKRFIRSLPTTAPAPSIAIDPDGEVSLDWDFGARRILSVSVGGSGRLAYAALIGTKKLRGTEWIDDSVPKPILEALSRVMGQR